MIDRDSHRRVQPSSDTNDVPMSRDHLRQTRVAYGDSARRFASSVGTVVSPDFEAPLDLAVLQTFAELAGKSGGPAVDAGCGTGRVARFLADHGLDVLGVDVAPGMIAEARAAHPDIAFEVAELADLPCAPGSLTAVAFWYSIITTPPDGLHAVWSEVRRTLAPSGLVLVAFQCGEGEHINKPGAYGTTSDLTLFVHDPDHVRSGMESAGLTIETFVRRARRFDHESTDQVFIIATVASH